jgi:hypothetical protein
MTLNMLNTPRHRVTKKCMFSCVKNNSPNFTTTTNTPHFNKAENIMHNANAIEKGYIKGKATFVKLEVNPQFGRYVGQGGTILNNF